MKNRSWAALPFMAVLLAVLLALTGSADAAPEAGDATGKLSEEEYKMFSPDVRLMLKSAGSSISYVLYIQKGGVGEIQQIRRPYLSAYAGPGDKLFFYFTVTGEEHTFNNGSRIGFQADYQKIIQKPDGSYAFGEDLIPIELKNFRMDGEPSPLWEGLDNQLIKSDSTDPAVATHGYKVFGKGRNHNPNLQRFGFNMTNVDRHYISFEMTIPENAYYIVFGQGSGCDGQSGGVISAKANPLFIYARSMMQFHYVLDSDYRKAQGYAGGEDTAPIMPRTLQESLFKLPAEVKELIPASEIYHAMPGDYIFPKKPEYFFNTIDPLTGAVVKQPDDVFLYNSGITFIKKPTYGELKKDIPGFVCVSDDLSRAGNMAPAKLAKYQTGPDNRLPEFDYGIDQQTGKLVSLRHYYFTYKPVQGTPPAPQTPPKPAPKTGDAGTAALWALTGASLAAAFLVLADVKRRREN